MEIRKTTEEDVPAVIAIYTNARAFMAAHGNATQWAGAYPGEPDVRADVASGNGYVVVEGGLVAGAFAFVVGEDPTYRVIEQGTWRSSEPYGAVHRIASSGVARGISQASFAFCAERMPHLRVDTHADNLPMQRAIERFGFERRGIIHVADGSPRLAYDWLAADAAC